MEGIRELQLCQLNILKEVDRLCEKYSIPYFLAYGTCIGAVRHKGFIPWDDDVDICMLAEDLERLKEHANELREPYFLQCHESDSEYGLMITRIRDSNTTLIEQTEAACDINHGVFMDIYPLFPTYPSSFRAGHKILCSYVYRLCLYGRAPYRHGGLVKIITNTFLSLLTPKMKEKIKKRAYSVMTKETKTDYVSIFYGGDEKVAFKKEWLFPTKKIPFEKKLFPVPNQVEKFLGIEYGDYMQLPPEEKRQVHHDYVLVDLSNSYLVYKGKYYCKGEEK